MDRRKAIKTISIGAGITISMGALMTTFSACQEEARTMTDGWEASFLDQQDAILLDELTDIILPPTDTPGAKEAHVIRYVDQIIGNVYKAKDQIAFNEGIAAFKAKVKAKYHIEPYKASREQLEQTFATHLKSLTDEKIDNIKKSSVQPYSKDIDERSGERNVLDEFVYSFYRLTIAGYYGSQLIGTEHLVYAPVPGPYQGCIPLEETNGISWAL